MFSVTKGISMPFTSPGFIQKIKELGVGSVLVFSLALFAEGCSTNGSCNNLPQRSSAPASDSNQDPATRAGWSSDQSANSDLAQVFVKTGEKQCARGVMTPIKDWQKIFGEHQIDILKSETSHDGFMHCFTCYKCDTGSIYVFTIPAKELKSALEIKGVHDYGALKKAMTPVH